MSPLFAYVPYMGNKKEKKKKKQQPYIPMEDDCQGGSRISGKGVHMYKGVGFALLIFSLIFLKYPMKMK